MFLPVTEERTYSAQAAQHLISKKFPAFTFICICLSECQDLIVDEMNVVFIVCLCIVMFV